jgi:hypothetical protein
MRKYLFVCSKILLLHGCSTPEISVLLKDLKTSTDSTYGYTPTNPILFGYYDSVEKNISAAGFYLFHLSDRFNRKSKFSPVIMVDATNIHGLYFSILRPLKPNRDTIKLYFNLAKKGPLYIPKGLIFPSSLRK